MTDTELLASLMPPEGMSPDKLQKLLSQSETLEVAEGEYLLQQGDNNKRIVFLLNGAIQLTSTDNDKTMMITGGTRPAKSPLNHVFPRTMSVKALTPCQYLSIDPDAPATAPATGQSKSQSAGDELQKLALLTPLAGLQPEHLKKLLAQSKIFDVTEGGFVFRQGDNDKRMIFVLKGATELTSDDSEKRTLITGGTRLAKEPLGHFFPRPLTAKALTTCQCIAIDSDVLDQILDESKGGDQSEGMTEDEREELQLFLSQTLAFQQLSEGNVDEFIDKMDVITTDANKLIIKQGTNSDCFYILKSGKCQVNRITPARPKGIILGEIKPGESFGEDGLISGMKRNANIASMTDVELLRLSKKDFMTILFEPKIQWASQEDAEAEVNSGNAKWIDVRLPNEYAQSHMSGSDNIPLSILRVKMKQMDKESTYIIYCDNGNRSAAAGYLLIENGYDVYIVENGIQDMS